MVLLVCRLESASEGVYASHDSLLDAATATLMCSLHMSVADWSNFASVVQMCTCKLLDIQISCVAAAYSLPACAPQKHTAAGICTIMGHHTYRLLSAFHSSFQFTFRWLDSLTALYVSANSAQHEWSIIGIASTCGPHNQLRSNTKLHSAKSSIATCSPNSGTVDIDSSVLTNNTPVSSVRVAMQSESCHSSCHCDCR